MWRGTRRVKLGSVNSFTTQSSEPVFSARFAHRLLMHAGGEDVAPFDTIDMSTVAKSVRSTSTRPEIGIFSKINSSWMMDASPCGPMSTTQPRSECASISLSLIDSAHGKPTPGLHRPQS